MFNAGRAVRQAIASQATVSMLLSDLAGPNGFKAVLGCTVLSVCNDYKTRILLTYFNPFYL